MFAKSTFPVIVFIVLSTTLLYAEQTVRVLSYNVRNCRGLNSNEITVEKTAQVIANVKPDVVGIQELDCKTKRSSGRDILTELSQKTNLNGSYGPAINYQGGQYGIGALTKLKPIDVRTVPLPGTEERRVLLIAEFEKYVFFVTHLSLTKNCREQSVGIINAQRDKYSKPVILVGDFNAKPNSKTILEFQKTWQTVSADANTFPANRPSERIDYIFVWTPNAQPVRVLNTHVVEATSQSDHRPIVTEIELP